MWEDLFLREIKIICPVKQNLNLWTGTSSWILSIFVPVSYSNMLMLIDWYYKTHNTGTLNLEENKFVYKKGYP